MKSSFSVLGRSSQHRCQLPFFLVSLTWRFRALGQDQMSGRAFWLSDVYPRFKPPKFGCHWVMKRSWRSPFQGNSRAIFLLVVLNQKDSRKLEMSAWRVIVSHLRKLEEFGIQSSLCITKPQRQLIGLESNIYKCANIIFFSLQLPPFLSKFTVRPFFLFCIKIGLIIYISLARIVIE